MASSRKLVTIYSTRYDENPECAFSPEALDFAVHVRMGDRREFLDGGNDGYFQLLETFMGTISAGVLERGLPQPVFHIFSETLKPCPSQITGLFDEFPAWPVDLNEVSPLEGNRESDKEF